MAWPVGLSLLVLGAILWITWEPGTVAALGGSLRWGPLALAVLTVPGYLLVGALRLRYISHRHLGLKGALRGQIAWDFMSAVTPSAIGGAPLASYFVAKDNGLPVGEATALMLFSMLTDQLWFALSVVLLGLAALAMPVFPEASGVTGAIALAGYGIGFMTWTAFFAYAVVVNPAVLERFMLWVVRFPLLRRFEGRVAEEAVALKRRSAMIRGESAGFFLAGLGFAAGVWLQRYLCVVLVAWSVTPDLDAALALARTAGMWLTALVVPTPGGSGGIEGLFLLFVAPILESDLVGPVLLVWRVLSYHLIVVIGLGVAARLIGKRVAAGRVEEPTADIPTHAR
jgi:uncharacterized protein (TIRG00374 family)